MRVRQPAELVFIRPPIGFFSRYCRLCTKDRVCQCIVGSSIIPFFPITLAVIVADENILMLYTM